MVKINRLKKTPVISDTGVNERFWQVAKELGLTTVGLSKAIPISYSMVTKIKSGHQPVTERIIMLMEKNLNVDSQWLMHGVGEHPFKNKVLPDLATPDHINASEDITLGMVMNVLNKTFTRIEQLEDRIYKTTGVKNRFPKVDTKHNKVANVKDLVVQLNTMLSRIEFLERNWRRYKKNDKRE
ncbi:helix-turn-helix domain-containing protein [Daejeonella rubra]|nr:helix-turn-helix transcriptional regulator [Daejeonella rubra]